MAILKSVRVPERAYGIVLWLVSVLLAAFIVGLGSLIIGDLPQVEQQISEEQFIDAPAIGKLRGELRSIEGRRGEIGDKLETAQLQLIQAWIQARTATTNPQQDPEVLARTHQLEQLKTNERTAQAAIDELENARLPLEQRETALREQESRLQLAAAPAFERAMFWQELRVFMLRLAITLPMLVFAVWLVAKKRKGEYWPLSRGLVLASVYVFFFELVPYLPSYGGYIRYGVGIILTFAAGHFLIKNMRHYLAQRQAEEEQVETERRKRVTHDEAFKKMAAKVCPGCDRPIASMEGIETNFCVHCGMTLFDHCSHCDARKMAFFRFCMACGTTAKDGATA